VRGYQLGSKLLVIVLNDQDRPQTVNLHSALSLWLPSTNSYKISSYDTEGGLDRSGGFTPPLSAAPVAPDGGVKPPLLEIIRNLRKLFQRSFQVLGDLGGDDVRFGQVGGIFQAVVFQPKDVEVPSAHAPSLGKVDR
jgi:hypothetical protein